MLHKTQCKENVSSDGHWRKDSARAQKTAFGNLCNLIVGDNNRILEDLSAQVTEGLKLGWLRKRGSDMWDLMQKTYAMTIATYKTVISIHELLQTHLERLLTDDSFMLEDALGRRVYVSLKWIYSWESFESWLQYHFREMQGQEKIMKGQYVLQDHATKTDIDRSQPWTSLLHPGKQISMVSTFRVQSSDETALKTRGCPNCNDQSTNYASSGVTWYITPI